jgi:hypothetical protein
VKFEVGVKVFAMTGFASIIPFGGVSAYGSQILKINILYLIQIYM